MKKTKFKEAQIVFALRQADTGITVAEVCRKMGVSEATYYNWRKKIRRTGRTRAAAAPATGRRKPAP